MEWVFDWGIMRGWFVIWGCFWGCIFTTSRVMFLLFSLWTHEDLTLITLMQPDGCAARRCHSLTLVTCFAAALELLRRKRRGGR